MLLLFPGTPLHLYASSLYGQPTPSYGDHVQERLVDVADDIAGCAKPDLWEIKVN